MGMKRIFDIVFVLGVAIVVAIPAVLVALAVKLTSSGPILYWSQRIGRGNAQFSMPKFRTMKIDTPAVASHLLSDPQACLTPIGAFLRRSSLDEIPQLWSILVGDMSVIGPRPALYNQYDLIKLRTSKGVSALVPGLTGWAQVNGRDNISIAKKVGYDEEYLRRRSLAFDFYILVLTVKKVCMREDVSH